MKQGLLWRIALALLVFIFSSAYLVPALLPEQEKRPSFLPDSRINLGLDLKGGIYLTLGIEVDKAVEISLLQTGRDVASMGGAKGLLMPKPRLLPGDKLELVLTVPEKRAEFEEFLAKNFPILVTEPPVVVGDRNLLYLASFTPAERARVEDMAVSQALTTIRNRIDQFGVAEPDIRKQQDGTIVIQLPGMQSTQRAVAIIGRTAHLEFRLVRSELEGRSILPPDVERLPYIEGKSGMQIVVEKEPALTGERVSNAVVQPDREVPGNYYVGISFDRRGEELFGKFTSENVGKQLAIVLDGKVYSAPVIRQAIYGDASISGTFSLEGASDLALVLRSGSLPAPVKVLEERTVGPSLGAESIERGVTAAVIGGLAIAVFMAIYYGMSGLVANAMLVLDVGLILAGLAGFGATLTLPGIAGIVLTLGMAVDANVLVFERIREELDKGLTPKAAVDAGFSRAMLAITDSNVTTAIAAALLYQFGTGPVRGFAVTLLLGIVISMFTAIFVSRIIFDIWMGKPGRKLRMGLHLIPNNLTIDFVGMRKISYILSVLLILAGIGAVAFSGGLRYGVDFSGGAAIQVKFDKAIDDAEIKDSLAASDLPGLAVQRFGENGQTYLLRLSAIQDSATTMQETVKTALETHMKGVGFEIQRVEMVGPKVGADLRAKALEAMYYALLITAIYISGRFERRWFTAGVIAAVLMSSMYGLTWLGLGKEYLVGAALLVTIGLCWKFRLIFALGSIVSILHDVLITMGLFALMGKEFDLTIIAALLTVVGYSLNDTIIVYDRIRENLYHDRETSLASIINHSINQTLSRTILTSGTTMLVILCLLIWGGGIIHDFALVMFIGVFVGTLSSMFVASPVLLVFGEGVINRDNIQPKKDTRPRDTDGRLAAQV